MLIAFPAANPKAEVNSSIAAGVPVAELSSVPPELAGSLRKSSGQLEIDRKIQATLFRAARAFSLPHDSYPLFQFLAAGSAYGSKALSLEDLVIKPGTQGLVALGVDLLDTELQTPGGQVAIETIIAHEFAHIYQAYAGLAEPLARFRQSSKVRELHADYMAGWFMRQSTTWNNEALARMLRALYERGDYLIDNADHHGTPAERFNATMEGFLKGSGASVSAAAANGRQFVETLVPP